MSNLLVVFPIITTEAVTTESCRFYLYIRVEEMNFRLSMKFIFLRFHSFGMLTVTQRNYTGII